MNDIRTRRIKFTRLLCQLIAWGNDHAGVEIALGRDFDEADPRELLHHDADSLHYIGLANDLALYVNGIYQEETEAYRFLGDCWKALDHDCCWGGDWQDGNHFSLTFKGKK